MIDKQLIVYGDSFADSTINPGWEDTVKHWFHFLVEHYTGQVSHDDFINRGRTGTSQMFSYSSFHNDLKKFNPKRIIFLFSSPRRAPIADGPMERVTHCKPGIAAKMAIRNCRTVIEKQEAKHQFCQIDAWFRYFIDNTKMLTLMQQGIFDNVQKECKKRNIQLVFLTCFNKILEPIHINFENAEYPVISNLEVVSRNEYPDPEDPHFVNYADPRIGHLNYTNNKQCAEIIIKCFDDQTPRVIKFDEVDGLDYSKETFNIYYSHKLEKNV